MTDEEIEFALEQYSLAGGSNVQNMDWAGTLDYINRLKEQLYKTEQKLAECEVGYLATLDLERRMRADDKEQIRKGTAKEILKIVESVKHGENGMRYRNPDCVIASKIKEKYGVEVDDE